LISSGRLTDRFSMTLDKGFRRLTLMWYQMNLLIKLNSFRRFLSTMR
jgi:hypothetical protein